MAKFAKAQVMRPRVAAEAMMPVAMVLFREFPKLSFMVWVRLLFIFYNLGGD